MAAVVGAQRSAPALARKGLTDNHAGGDRAVHIGSREHWKRHVTGVRAGRQWRAMECEQELSRGSVGAVVYNHGPSVLSVRSLGREREEQLALVRAVVAERG